MGFDECGSHRRLYSDCYIDICQTSEELTPEERDAEMLPIAVQHLYVLIRLGKNEEAEALLKEISVDE